MDLFWAILNLTLLLGLILGFPFLILYAIRKLRTIEKRLEHIEKKSNQSDN